MQVDLSRGLYIYVVDFTSKSWTFRVDRRISATSMLRTSDKRKESYDREKRVSAYSA